MTMPSILDMGMITQEIFFKCKGEHSFCHIDDPIDNADVYLLHCFKNQKYLDKFIYFQKPKNSKVISLIHSSFPCRPANCSDDVITISRAAQSLLLSEQNIKSKMIYGFSDLTEYFKAETDYSISAYGKVSRWEKGKFGKFNVAGKSFLISDDKDNLGKHFYQTIIRQIKIKDHADKIKAMQKYSIYADCHDPILPFVDTFNIAMLEAMALGQAVVILGTYQEAMAEILGNAGFVCYSVEKFEETLTALMMNENLRKEFGLRARERAKEFTSEKMIPKWNKLFKDVYAR